MSVSKPVVKCGSCGKVLNESADVQIENRNPCPECGSLIRATSISTGSSISLHSRLKLKARRASGGRPFQEQVVGDDLHRETGKRMKLRRVIDRARNWYSEIITGSQVKDTIHQCEEALSDHQGHGSARKTEEK